MRRAFLSAMGAGLALLALAGGCSEPPTVIDGSIRVSITPQPGVIQPGSPFAATILVEPSPERVLEHVQVLVSGLITSAETVLVNAPGTFTLRRTYFVPVSAGVGQVSVRAIARAGRSVGEGGTQVAVADTSDPRVISFTVTPTASVLQSGDSLTVRIEASDNAGLRATVIRLSGAITMTDSLDAGGQNYIARVFGHRVSRAVPLGQTLTVTAEAIDVAARRSALRTATRIVSDTLAPFVSGSFDNARGSTGFMPGDTVHLTLWARDNRLLARFGYRLAGAVTRADSFAVSDSAALRVIALPVTTAWSGVSTVTVFAQDSVGLRQEVPSGTITVADRTRLPVASAPVDATVADVAFDPKRGLLYLSQPDSARVAVLGAADATWRTPHVFTAGSQPRGLDVSLSGDSLLVALRRTNHVTVVDLVTGARDTVRVNTNPFQNRGPDNVRVMANGKVLVSITFDGGGYLGSLVSLDLATRAFVNRVTVTELTPLCRSGDRYRLLVLIDDVCCPSLAFVYDAATDFIGPQQGTLNRYFLFGSVDLSGSHFLVNGTAFSAALTATGSVAPGGYANGASVIAADGAHGFFATPSGVVRARLGDGLVLEAFTLGAQPYRLALSPDGFTLVAVTASRVFLIDLW